MLFAVAAASLKTISRSLTKPWAKMPARMVSRKSRPMMRARRSGEIIYTDYVNHMDSVRPQIYTDGHRSERTCQRDEFNHEDTKAERDNSFWPSWCRRVFVVHIRVHLRLLSHWPLQHFIDA